MVIDPHHAIESIGQRPVERRTQTFGLLLKSPNRRTDLEVSGAAALNGHGQTAAAENGLFAIPLGNVADREVILDVPLKQVPPLFADRLHDGALGKDERASFALPPQLRSRKPFPHQRRAKVIEQLSAEFVAISGWNRGERRQSLGESGRKGRYPRGGSRSDGTARGSLSAPACRSIASVRNRETARDSLHWRCLASRRLVSGGVAVAFFSKSAINFSVVVIFAGIVQPLVPMARLKV